MCMSEKEQAIGPDKCMNFSTRLHDMKLHVFLLAKELKRYLLFCSQINDADLSFKNECTFIYSFDTFKKRS
ncbi:hypothetical protein CTV99_02870 [Bacillus pumilus]|uniref:Uncharacterized protein n=1 Tax=Bacillus pumilus TaxID=1408 RepID=A0A2G8IXQ4_BACPU|nr:hypothetical protein CTV99_02870 [Bacillus pumilus]